MLEYGREATRVMINSKDFLFMVVWPKMPYLVAQYGLHSDT